MGPGHCHARHLSGWAADPRLPRNRRQHSACRTLDPMRPELGLTGLPADQHPAGPGLLQGRRDLSGDQQPGTAEPPAPGSPAAAPGTGPQGPAMGGPPDPDVQQRAAGLSRPHAPRLAPGGAHPAPAGLARARSGDDPNLRQPAGRGDPHRCPARLSGKARPEPAGPARAGGSPLPAAAAATAGRPCQGGEPEANRVQTR